MDTAGDAVLQYCKLLLHICHVSLLGSTAQYCGSSCLQQEIIAAKHKKEKGMDCTFVRHITAQMQPELANMMLNTWHLSLPPTLIPVPEGHVTPLAHSAFHRVLC